MKCPNCNEECMDGSTLCVKCGANLTQPQPPITPAPVAPVEETVPVAPAAPVEETVPVETTPVAPMPNVAPAAPMPDVAPVSPQPEVAPAAPMPNVAPVAPQPEVAPAAPMPDTQPAVQPQVIANPAATPASQTPVAPKEPNKFLELLKKYKFYLLGAVGVIILLIVIIPLLNTSSSKADYGLIYDAKNPIIIKKDGKYGFVNSNGKVILEPKYEDLSYFVGDYAVGVLDESKEDAENYYEVINNKGKVALTAKYYSLDLDVENGTWIINDHLYDKNLKQLTPNELLVDYEEAGYLTYTDIANNESGIMNSTGKKLYVIKESSVSSVDISLNEYDEKEVYAIVSPYTDGKEIEYIISLKNGKKLYDLPDPDKYYSNAEDNGIFYYYPDGEYDKHKFLYFYNNKLAYEATDYLDDMEVYDYKNQILKLDYGYDYDELGKKQRYYYYDVKNKTMLDKYDADDEENNLLEATYGYKTYSTNYKYGIMQDKTVIVEAKYDSIDFIDKEAFLYLKDKKNIEPVLLEKDDKTTLMNISNQKELFTFNSDTVYNEGTFVYGKVYDDDYELKEYEVYNLLTGKSLTISGDNDIDFTPTSLEVTKDKKTTYYNVSLEKVYES